MLPTTNTYPLAIKAGPFERHYTTCRDMKIRHYKIHEGKRHKAVQFIIGQVFKPSAFIDENDLKLLPKNSLVQFCGNYRFIQLSQYDAAAEEEIFISFFISDFHVLHPYQYCILQTNYDKWRTRRATWNKIERFPDLRGHINFSFFHLLRILFFIHACEGPQKIP